MLVDFLTLYYLKYGGDLIGTNWVLDYTNRETRFVSIHHINMASSDNVVVDDEPLTPAGRLFLHPKMDTIIHCLFGFEYTIGIDEIKSAVSNSVMLQHPRFCSLMVRDRHGREHWRKTQIDIDRHVILVDQPLGDDTTRAVNEYLADLAVSSPLSADKPLWEFHVLMPHNCAVFRIHHSLGDGISLMSMLLASCRTVDDATKVPSLGGGGQRMSSGGGGGGGGVRWKQILLILIGLLKTLVFGLMFIFQFILKFWIRDRKTVITGGAGVELWPRKLATATFRLDDMKAVKNAIVGSVSSPKLKEG